MRAVDLLESNIQMRSNGKARIGRRYQLMLWSQWVGVASMGNCIHWNVRAKRSPGHETANEFRDFIGGGIQGEVPRIKDMNLSLRHVAPVGLRLCGVKG